MSHISLVSDFEIGNLDCLKQACKVLGFTFIENQKHYAWYGHWVGDYPLPKEVKVEDLGKCDHAIKVPGCRYEIGVIKIKEKPGKYRMYYDFYGTGGLDKIIGQNGGPLKAEYTHQAMKYLQLRGKAKHIMKKETEEIVELTMTI